MAATLTAILDALSDYADFEEVGSVSRAQTYITACRRFLALPSSQADKGSSLGYSPEHVKEQMQLARQFIAANQSASSGTSVRFLSASEGFRR